MCVCLCVWKATALVASRENVTSLAKWAGTARQWWIWSFREGLIFLTCWWENVLIKKQRQKEKANWSHLWPPFPSLLHCLACMFCCMWRGENATDCAECAERERCSKPSRECGWHMENNTCSKETEKRQERWKQNENGKWSFQTYLYMCAWGLKLQSCLEGTV